MSDYPIVQRLEADGSFPNASVVAANFEMLFKVAREGGTPLLELTEDFHVALDQHAHIDAGGLGPALARRVQVWVLSRWAEATHEEKVKLCGLLVNVPSPEIRAFLQDQRDRCEDPEFRDDLAHFLVEMNSR